MWTLFTAELPGMTEEFTFQDKGTYKLTSESIIFYFINGYDEYDVYFRSKDSLKLIYKGTIVDEGPFEAADGNSELEEFIRR